jgi:hypothetical protein
MRTDITVKISGVLSPIAPPSFPRRVLKDGFDDLAERERH